MDDINKRVLLLAIYKKKDDESFMDVVKTMDNSKVFTLKQGKKYLKELKKESFLSDSSLTMLGIEKAKEVEQEFKI